MSELGKGEQTHRREWGLTENRLVDHRQLVLNLPCDAVTRFRIR
jgi:hypothetical protein